MKEKNNDKLQKYRYGKIQTGFRFFFFEKIAVNPYIGSVSPFLFTGTFVKKTLLTSVTITNQALLALGVQRGSVVKCLTRNSGLLGSSRTGSSGFFVGVSLGKILQSPSLVLVKLRKDMNNVSYRRDMTNTVKSSVKHHSINQSI